MLGDGETFEEVLDHKIGGGVHGNIPAVGGGRTRASRQHKIHPGAIGPKARQTVALGNRKEKRGGGLWQ